MEQNLFDDVTVGSMDNDTLKTCCAAVYESEWTKLLLGNSFHPGGVELTQHLGQQLQLSPGDHVLDVAAGQGTSAILLAQQFGCRVTGIEYGKQAVTVANTAVSAANLVHLVKIKQGDAEALPFADDCFDVLICECAFCTFPRKETAVSEFARVTKPGGRIGLSDLTKSGTLPPELAGLMAWIACIADAQSVETYRTYLEQAKFTINTVERHDKALADMVRDVQAKLFGAELLVKLNKLPLADLDFSNAKKIARAAHQAVRQGKLGYALLIGQKT